jgi:hypothetical protein
MARSDQVRICRKRNHGSNQEASLAQAANGHSNTLRLQQTTPGCRPPSLSAGVALLACFSGNKIQSFVSLKSPALIINDERRVSTAQLIQIPPATSVYVNYVILDSVNKGLIAAVRKNQYA